jgi:hypothetical protein
MAIAVISIVSLSTIRYRTGCLVASLDRGHFVRTKDAYLALVQPYFKNVEVTIYNGMIRIPYSHVVLEMSAPIAR